MTYMAAYAYCQDGRHLKMMRAKPCEYNCRPRGGGAYTMYDAMK